jgi:PKD repeat protein
MFLEGVPKMKNVLRVLFVLSLGLLASCGDDEVNSVINGFTPNQVSLGQQGAVGTITGRELNATAVSLGDGISVTSFSVKSASEIEVTFNVSLTAVPGPRNITLTTATGTVNGNGLVNVIGNKVPKAEFKVSPSAGSLSTVFEFDAGGSVDQAAALALSYNWSFGDGATATGRKVKHRYQALGVHEVSLKVTDEQGGSSVATRSVEVLKNSPPVPVIKIRPGAKGNTLTNFILDGSDSRDPDGRVTDWIWDLGDKSRKKRGKEVEHKFDKAGEFEVSLTVVDNKGQLATDSKQIEVEKATSVTCAGNGSGHPGILRGDVVAIEPGGWAVVDFGRDASCRTHWHKCDDFRKWGADGLQEFFGIAAKMQDRGNGILAVNVACPLRWPPSVGEEVFLYYKTCQQNHCPGRPNFP